MTGIHPITRQWARKLRGDMTPQERKLWAKLRELNPTLSFHFRRQAPIGPFIADFADLGRRLVIEVDGGGHGGPRDAIRDEWLNGQGFQVLRFWNNDVDGNIEGVMQVIVEAVEASPPPQPSPTRGEGGAGSDGARLIARPVTSRPPRGDGPGVGDTPSQGTTA